MEGRKDYTPTLGALIGTKTTITSIDDRRNSSHAGQSPGALGRVFYRVEQWPGPA
ncbi:hypothetical protein [Pyrodictium abyssi]|uniref:hypothetical protein n=1 Tax=Pyrodictium abyssi TaxID=54256 RepID=UPI0030C681EC